MEKCQEAWVVQQPVYKDQTILSHKNPFYRLPHFHERFYKAFKLKILLLSNLTEIWCSFFSLTGETKSQHELSRPQVDVIKQHVSVDK